MAVVEPIRSKKKIDELIKCLTENYTRRDAMLFRLGVNTILRIGDLLKLKYSDVFDEYDEYRSYLILSEQKTRKAKKIALNGKIRRYLRKYCQHYDLTGDDYIFFSYRIPTKAIDRIQAWRVLKDAATRCKIENFGTHTMRKTLAYHVYKKTNNIGLVMEMLNHSNPAVTMRYIGINQELIDAIYNDPDFQY